MSSDAKHTEIRTRFAPSPTGFLHFGSARTAFFNWLFARANGGKFILRIEDTDKERSKPEYEKDILDGLRWLGLHSSENPEIGGDFGPYRQSERLEIYKKYLQKLFDENKVYYCFCSPEDLEAIRQSQMSQGQPPKYTGKCRSIPHAEALEHSIKEKAVIRLKMPEKTVSWNDGVKGKIQFDLGLIDDIIIAKGLTEPLYNFAVVVDDYEMKISHVIRGEDHISNTPKQIAIAEALGFPNPIYAHLPLLLDKNKKKLSKRDLEKSIKDYADIGYLPEAMLNFLVLLGWHPSDDKEVLSVDEMMEKFSLDRVQKSGAVFNEEKLNWFNAHYLKTMGVDNLLKRLESFIPASWYENKSFIKKVLTLEIDRIKTLKDFISIAGFLFELPTYESKMLIWKETPRAGVAANLDSILEILQKMPADQFNKNDLEKEIMPLAEARGRGEVLWPLRVALSGLEHSPGPIEIIETLGKEESIKRVKNALNKLQNQVEMLLD